MKEYNFTPKYKVGDTVYVMDYKNRCRRIKVTSISAHINYTGRTTIYYSGQDSNSAAEEYVFASLAEVRQHVFHDFLAKKEALI